jgi:hypothetical protein
VRHHIYIFTDYSRGYTVASHWAHTSGRAKQVSKKKKMKMVWTYLGAHWPVEPLFGVLGTSLGGKTVVVVVGKWWWWVVGEGHATERRSMAAPSFGVPAPSRGLAGGSRKGGGGGSG